MIYVTVKQSPKYRQLTLDDILAGEVDIGKYVVPNETNTKTYVTASVNYNTIRRANIQAMRNILVAFNEKYKKLIESDKQPLYSTYHIPKRSGGLRRIDEPTPILKEAQTCLREIFKNHMKALYHTSAFAYVEGRSAVDAVRRHQANDSRWFAKFDFSDFFGNSTEAFVYSMISMVFPFSEIVKTQEGADELKKALSICFLNGGLPQGSTISPLLTNIMMIPIDHQLCNSLRTLKIDDDSVQGFVYTRYADDILISSKTSFDINDITKHIEDTLNEYNAPFTINPKKTRYGSRAGRNWNLGVMLNKDNEITIGHKKKKLFKAMINNYITDKIRHITWDLHDVQTLQGKISYYKMIEKDYIEYVLNHYNEKYNVNIMALIRSDIKGI